MISDAKLSPCIRGTRRRLLEQLLGVDSSAVVLAQHLGINISAIRNHLTALEIAGLVSSRLEHAERGRPKRLYSLTHEALKLFPNRMSVVFSHLIQVLEQQLDKRTLISILRVVTKRMKQEILPIKPSGNLETRLRKFVQILDAYGFYPSLARIDDTFVIEYRNCVFRDIMEGEYADLGRLLCQMKRELLEDVAEGASVEWLHSTETTDQVCRGIVKS